VPISGITSVGFAFKNYDEVWGAMDGPLGDHVRSEIAKPPIFTVSKIWDNGFRHVTSSTREIRGPADLKGFKLRVPLFGDLIRKTAISRFSRTLGTLVTSGVPILQALNITRETAGNTVIAGAINQVHDAVKEGESIVQPHCDQIIPVIAQMFALGNKAACNVVANSSNAMLASAHQPSPTLTAGPGATMPSPGSAFADVSSLSLSNSSDNMLGLHGLLDLLFAVVFESPQALQV